MAGPGTDRRGTFDERVEGQSDRPTMPGDVDEPLGASSRTAAARRHLAGLPSSDALTAKTRAREMLALIENERLLAKTSASGVREVAPEIASMPRDISGAVTAVHRAVELDAFAPPSVEVTVVVNQTLVLEQPTEPRVRDDGVAEEVSEPLPLIAPTRDRTMAVPDVVAQPVPQPQSRAPLPLPLPRRARGRARRVLAALLFLLIMASAIGLLTVALCSRAGLGRTPQEIMRHLRERAR